MKPEILLIKSKEFSTIIWSKHDHEDFSNFMSVYLDYDDILAGSMDRCFIGFWNEHLEGILNAISTLGLEVRIRGKGTYVNKLLR